MRLIPLAIISLSSCSLLMLANCLASPSLEPLKANKTLARKQRDSVYQLSDAEVATLLGYYPQKKGCSLCDGYYLEPRIVKDFPKPLAPTAENSEVTAQGPAIFNQTGESILQKNVRATQPGRLSTADTAYIFRDKDTGNTTLIQLVGNVHMEEYGRMILSNDATLDLVKDSATLNESLYHMHDATKEAKNTACIRNTQDAYGRATRVHRDKKGILELWNATFTTCSPLHPSWKVSASKITIDHTKKVVKAKNAVIRFKHIPIFYTPYLSFSTDKQRKTGFLMPNFTYSQQNGSTFGLPFYWNMASNFDDTITPKYYSKRGVDFSNYFRYLTPSSGGDFLLSYLPDDRAFSNYQQQINAQFGPNPPSLYAPYVSQLESESNDRFFGVFNNNSRDGRFSSDINLNYVSDDYYFIDFGNRYSIVNANQLLNQADVEYTGEHWDLVGLIQGYETLHPLNQVGSTSFNQYTRLPELDTNANYPDFLGKLGFNLDAQVVNFIYSSSFTPLTYQEPIGERLHLRPTFNYPINWASTYLTPSIFVDSTNYSAQNAAIYPSQSRTSFSGSRDIPGFDIDSGEYFSRHFNFEKTGFTETLEPRAFYLYVPYVNQNQYPNFDTELLPFSYAQLFSTNRFTGFDRLENANQMSLGVTSRILNDKTTAQELKFDLGTIYYIENPEVNLNGQTITGNINQENGNVVHWSPVLGQVTYYPAQYWSTSANMAYDFPNKQMNNAGVTASYSQDSRHIGTIGYIYVQEIDGIPVDALGQSTATSLVDIGSTWPINERWSLFGYWYYNIALTRANSYYAGLEYDSCCWAFRFIAKRTFTGVGSDSEYGNVDNQFNNSYYVQFDLKGLGGVGNSDAASFLQETLPGYHDSFSFLT